MSSSPKKLLILECKFSSPKIFLLKKNWLNESILKDNIDTKKIIYKYFKILKLFSIIKDIKKINKIIRINGTEDFKEINISKEINEVKFKYK